MSEPHVTKQDREAEFWDKVIERSLSNGNALRIGPDDLCDPAVPWFKTLDLDIYVEGMFSHLGLKPGMRVLDLGCGRGFLSVALGHRGAIVEGIDISPKSIEFCQRRSEQSGVAERVRFSVMDCEQLDFGDSSFDAVCGCFVLHHLDLEKAAREIGRVLKPHGRSAFIETMGLNPLLMIARATLPGRMNIEKASSDDEYPLNRDRLDTLRANFPGTMNTSFPQVVFLRMGGYLPFMDHALGRGALTSIDHLLARLPGMGRLSYYGLVTLDRRGATH